MYTYIHAHTQPLAGTLGTARPRRRRSAGHCPPGRGRHPMQMRRVWPARRAGAPEAREVRYKKSTEDIFPALLLKLQRQERVRRRRRHQEPPPPGPPQLRRQRRGRGRGAGLASAGGCGLGRTKSLAAAGSALVAPGSVAASRFFAPCAPRRGGRLQVTQTGLPLVLSRCIRDIFGAGLLCGTRGAAREAGDSGDLGRESLRNPRAERRDEPGKRCTGEGVRSFLYGLLLPTGDLTELLPPFFF